MAPKAKSPDDDDIDYGATADMHVSDDDASTAEGEDDPAIEVAVAEDEDSSSASSGSDSDDDQEAMDDNDNAEEEESSGEQDDGEEEDEEEYPSNNNIVVDGGDEPCTFDLRNLLAFNAHPIDTAALYAAPLKNDSVNKQPTPGRVTIPSVITVDEKHLYQKAEAGCQQLIAALWQLPTERSDAGPMVKLPSTDDSRVPRALVC
jgi:Ribosome biogenesis regulatory protein (RRS1)